MPLTTDQETYLSDRGAFAQQMVAALETALAKSPTVLTVSVDGESITYKSRAEMLAEYQLWTKRSSRFLGIAPRAAQIYLGGFR